MSFFKLTHISVSGIERNSKDKKMSFWIKTNMYLLKIRLLVFHRRLLTKMRVSCCVSLTMCTYNSRLIIFDPKLG